MLLAIWSLFITALVVLVFLLAVFSADLAFALIVIGCFAVGLLSGYTLNDEAIPEPYLIAGGGLLIIVTLVGSYLLFFGLAIFGAGLGTAIRKIFTTRSSGDNRVK
ncbi:MAG: hypothetical protein V3S98_10625 [Dehalococcoidia bacterium]